MLRLRTADGLPLAGYAALAGRSLLEDAGAFLGELCRQGLLVMDKKRIALTPRGMLVSSAVTSELFLPTISDSLRMLEFSQLRRLYAMMRSWSSIM